MSLFISLFHIFVVGTLFLYLGIRKTNIPNIMYSFLLVFGIIIVIYHIYKLYIYGRIHWINLMHILLIGPILMYIGYNKERTERMLYEIVLLLGFATIGYHGYYTIMTK